MNVLKARRVSATRWAITVEYKTGFFGQHTETANLEGGSTVWYNSDTRQRCSTDLESQVSAAMFFIHEEIL